MPWCHMASLGHNELKCLVHSCFTIHGYDYVNVFLFDFQNQFELTLSQALGMTGKKESDPLASSKLNKVGCSWKKKKKLNI